MRTSPTRQENPKDARNPSAAASFDTTAAMVSPRARTPDRHDTRAVTHENSPQGERPTFQPWIDSVGGSVGCSPGGRNSVRVLRRMSAMICMADADALRRRGYGSEEHLWCRAVRKDPPDRTRCSGERRRHSSMSTNRRSDRTPWVAPGTPGG
jgi:hypothetical protein